MGMWRRLVNAVSRVFSSGKDSGDYGDRDIGDTGGVTGDSFTAEGDMPSGWDIYATSPGGGVVDPYEGGDLPAYTHTLRSRIIVGYKHGDGTITYRTIHGPVRDIDQVIDLIIRVTVVVSPAE